MGFAKAGHQRALFGFGVTFPDLLEWVALRKGAPIEGWWGLDYSQRLCIPGERKHPPSSGTRGTRTLSLRLESLGEGCGGWDGTLRAGMRTEEVVECLKNR